MAQDGPKMAQDGPKMAQDGPKMAQDGPKMAPKVFQEGSKNNRNTKTKHTGPQKAKTQR
jgi:hypothetical protein